MNSNDLEYDLRFKRRYRRFYTILCIVASCVIIGLILAMKHHEINHQQEIKSYSFNGHISKIIYDEKHRVEIVVNGKQYDLTSYNTGWNFTYVKPDNFVPVYSSDLNIGDSVLKESGRFSFSLFKPKMILFM